MRFLTISLVFVCVSAVRVCADPLDARVIRPDATVDLMTRDGVELVQAQWKYADARIVPTDDGKMNDIEPKAGAIAFDDSAWTGIEPSALSDRRGGGRLSFGWYRIMLTIPQRVGQRLLRRVLRLVVVVVVMPVAVIMIVIMIMVVVVRVQERVSDLRLGHGSLAFSGAKKRDARRHPLNVSCAAPSSPRPAPQPRASGPAAVAPQTGPGTTACSRRG